MNLLARPSNDARSFGRALDDYLIYLNTQSLSHEHYTYSARKGRSWTKIVKVERGGKHFSVVSFVDGEGRIWAAASWKAPARNYPRGSIYDLHP